MNDNMIAVISEKDVVEFRSYFKLLLVAPNSLIDENINLRSKMLIFSTSPFNYAVLWRNPSFCVKMQRF